MVTSFPFCKFPFKLKRVSLIGILSEFKTVIVTAFAIEFSFFGYNQNRRLA